MATSAAEYMDLLEHVLRRGGYDVPNSAKTLTLKERGASRSQTVKIHYQDRAIGFRLDFEVRGPKETPPLFHFLEDEAQSWSKRCDFIVFHKSNSQMHVYAIEFKSGTVIQANAKAQLDAGESWVRSLHATLKSYGGKHRQLRLHKYLISASSQPSTFCTSNGFLRADHQIRHYSYAEIKALSLDTLDRSKPITIP